MQSRSPRCPFCGIAVLVLSVLAADASAQTTESLRVVAYNMESDIQAYGDLAPVTTPRTGFYQVLEGIGEEDVGGNVQPIDILGLEETTSNATTVQPIVTALNTYYGAGTYAMSTYQGTQYGSNGSGNGPNAMVYNTKTVQLIASVGVGTPDGYYNGEYRQVVRYQFRPVGGNSNNDFYVYVTHMKSSAGDTTPADYYQDETSRNQEAAIIRANAATLPSNCSVLYMGDFNLSNTNGYANPNNSSQTASAYQAMVGTNPMTGANLSPGRAIDPLNSGNADESWELNSTYKAFMTVSSDYLRYRDDFQLMTQNVFNATGSLQYVSGSLHPFGNDGHTNVYGNPSTTSTSLKNLLLRGDLNQDGSVTSADISQMLSALSDMNGYQSSHSISAHLFSTADMLAVADINRDGVINNADLQALLLELQNPNAANTPVPRSIVAPDLATASDHLPIVADYTVTVGGGSLAPVPEPSALALLSTGSLLFLWRRAGSPGGCV
jgi:endonuclease/exonuclease/phosphatase family metal-dependent hydrolase